jgi:hypothetical protein
MLGTNNVKYCRFHYIRCINMTDNKLVKHNRLQRLYTSNYFNAATSVVQCSPLRQLSHARLNLIGFTGFFHALNRALH